MDYFIYIFTNIIFPIFLIIAIGFILYKKFNLDIKSLTKVQFYALIPSLLFINIYNSQLDMSLIVSIMSFTLSLFIIMFAISIITSKLFKFEKSAAKAFVNSVILFNSGNYGLPLINLLFGSAYAVSIHVILFVVQNIITNTIGLFNSSYGNGGSVKEALKNMVKLPMIYFIILAFVLRAYKLVVPEPIMSSFSILSKGMVPGALLILGAQLAKTNFNLSIKKVYFSNFLRLLIAPTTAYVLTLLFGLSGITAQVLVIASSAPTAINSVLLAIEYDNEPDFASQTVLTSTLLSTITVTTVIYLATMYL